MSEPAIWTQPRGTDYYRYVSHLVQAYELGLFTLDDPDVHPDARAAIEDELTIEAYEDAREAGPPARSTEEAHDAPPT
jgi:hypothetical protein